MEESWAELVVTKPVTRSRSDVALGLNLNLFHNNTTKFIDKKINKHEQCCLAIYFGNMTPKIIIERGYRKANPTRK